MGVRDLASGVQRLLSTSLSAGRGFEYGVAMER